MLPSHPHAPLSSSCFLLILQKLPEAPALFRKIITAAIPPCNSSAKSPIASTGMEASHRFAAADDTGLPRIHTVRFVGAFLQLYSPSAPSRFHAKWPQRRSFKVFTASWNGIKKILTSRPGRTILILLQRLLFMIFRPAASASSPLSAFFRAFLVFFPLRHGGRQMGARC